jgi:hypothetical protein
VAHPLAQVGIERYGEFGDSHLPGSEIIDDFLRLAGGVEAQRAAQLRRAGPRIAGRVDSGGSRDPCAQPLGGLADEELLACLVGQRGGGKVTKRVQGNQGGRKGFGGQAHLRRAHGDQSGFQPFRAPASDDHVSATAVSGPGELVADALQGGLRGLDAAPRRQVDACGVASAGQQHGAVVLAAGRCRRGDG